MAPTSTEDGATTSQDGVLFIYFLKGYFKMNLYKEGHF